MVAPNDALENYRLRYPLKAMRRPPANPDELKLMEPKDGRTSLPGAPAIGFPTRSSLPDSAATAKENRHLWVVTADDVPVALEFCHWGVGLQSGCVKHSNLTGGADAHSGGEIWFIGNDRVVINAASGRYGAISDAELDEIADALRSSGYTVASMGFDQDNPAVPNRVLIGPPRWR